MAVPSVASNYFWRSVAYFTQIFQSNVYLSKPLPSRSAPLLEGLSQLAAARPAGLLLGEGEGVDQAALLALPEEGDEVTGRGTGDSH